jgi:hypothetical protein
MMTELEHDKPTSFFLEFGYWPGVVDFFAVACASDPGGGGRGVFDDVKTPELKINKSSKIKKSRKFLNSRKFRKSRKISKSKFAV